MPSGRLLESSETNARACSSVCTAAGYEVDPVGVHFNRRCAFVSQPVEHLVDDLPTTSRDFGGHARIGKMVERRPQVTVKGIDQNLKSLLQRLMVLPLVR